MQPKLSAISGVQRADILGDRTFAMRIWLKPDQMAALGISPSAVRDALARNNYLSALGQTKGSMVSVNLVANTDLRHAGGVPPAGGQGAERRRRPARRHRRRRARRRELRRRTSASTARPATFMGVWVLPTANSLDVIEQVRAAMPGHPGAAAGRA